MASHAIVVLWVTAAHYLLMPLAVLNAAPRRRPIAAGIYVVVGTGLNLALVRPETPLGTGYLANESAIFAFGFGWMALVVLIVCVRSRIGRRGSAEESRLPIAWWPLQLGAGTALGMMLCHFIAYNLRAEAVTAHLVPAGMATASAAGYAMLRHAAPLWTMARSVLAGLSIGIATTIAFALLFASMVAMQAQRLANGAPYDFETNLDVAGDFPDLSPLVMRAAVKDNGRYDNHLILAVERTGSTQRYNWSYRCLCFRDEAFGV